MPKVTRFGYALETAMIKKIDLLAKRCTQKNPKRDAILNIEGAEGEGKTSLSVAIAYYVSEITGRPFTDKQIFFDCKPMIEFLQSTEGQIAIWDEPALQALSNDAVTKIYRDLKRLLMLCRKKRHFIIINMTYFNEFGSYVAWMRPNGMFHVYTIKDKYAGRYIYIPKKKLEYLYNEWRRKRTRAYNKYGTKKCRGGFPDVLNPDYKNNVLSEFDVESYEKQKDKAIMSVGNDGMKDLSPQQIQKKTIMEVISKAKAKGISIPKIAEILGINKGTISKWMRGIDVAQVSSCEVSSINALGLNGDDVTQNPELTSEQDIIDCNPEDDAYFNRDKETSIIPNT